MTTLWLVTLGGVIFGGGCDGAGADSNDEAVVSAGAEGTVTRDGGAVGATTGSPSDGGSVATGADGGGASSQQCLAADVLTRLGGKTKLLVGGDFDDTVAATAPFDIRYRYLAGGVPSGEGACTSCSDACASPAGKSWWGCWQDTSLPPGDYLRKFVNRAADQGHLPMVTYYELLDASGAAEGAPQVAAMGEVPVMRRYFTDFRFMLQQLGGARALLHLEPDLWGYLQQRSANPRAVPVAVASANSTDCAGLENTAAGFGQCLVQMVRRYAPNTLVGLHASGWATGVDALYNRDPSHDVTQDAFATARFLSEVAPDADFVAIGPSDRDAGYYESLGKQKWWDAADATLPNFRQAFAWARALTETMGKPALWWQVPLGNPSLPNVANRWKDNRVDTLFARPDALAASNAFGVVFGAGRSDQTKPSTDDGNLSSKARAYAESGGVPACR